LEQRRGQMIMRAVWAAVALLGLAGTVAAYTTDGPAGAMVLGPIALGIGIWTAIQTWLENRFIDQAHRERLAPHQRSGG
jgi:hypothetical protein